MQMMCQALLARHAQSVGVTVVAEQQERGGGKWAYATYWNASFMLMLSVWGDFHMERKMSFISSETWVEVTTELLFIFKGKRTIKGN